MGEMTSCRVQPIVDWLVDGARSAAESEQVLAELCARLLEAGVPLWRVAVFVRTLHPQVMGRRFVWRADAGVATLEALHAIVAGADYQASPLARVYATGVGLRRRLADGDCPIDFPILQELRDEGATDYLVSPLIFTDGAIHAATWTTQQKGGFTAAQLAAIEAIVGPLARVTEVRALRRTASTLLDTYVGRQAGERILAGQIRRGDTEAIDAAIWLSDMRGFTALADRLPPQHLIDLLNRFFDCQIPAIVEHGGEVLKFIGDGLLAIFPIGDSTTDAAKVCQGALAAAEQARANVAALTGIDGVDRVSLGLALHRGTLLYGNIGGGNRLDFTSIGPAVNLAARIEKLAGRLGRTILASSEFARCCGAELAPVGEFALPGVSVAQQVFGLIEERDEERSNR
jgi:adenylate cyclase